MNNNKNPLYGFQTNDYYDIMYPTWSFWEGGPAISLYPSGIGRWDKHRKSISAAAEKYAIKLIAYIPLGNQSSTIFTEMGLFIQNLL